MCSTRTLGCDAASESSRAGVPSVDPSSTKITSYSSLGSDWPISESMHSSMLSPGLKTGTITLTLSMGRNLRRAWLASIALALVALTVAAPADARRIPCHPGSQARCFVWTGRVVFVADGDTVDVKLDGGGTRRVRLTAINATELTRYSHKARLRRGECHGVAATNRLERMIRKGHWRVRLLAQHPGGRSP